MVEKTIIPEAVLKMAAQRDILAIEPYHEDDHTVDKLYYDAKLLIPERNNPNRILDEQARIRDYLASQGLKEVELLEFLMDEDEIDADEINAAGVNRINGRFVTGMDPNCKVSVIIPARFEQDRIRQTLDGYAAQVDVDPTEYELNIIVNHRIDETPDGTSHEILDFMEENPDIRVNFIDVQFDKDHAKVGWARKLIVDLSLARAIMRDHYDHPLYIITEDADVRKIDPSIVTKTIDEFEKYPEIDFLRGKERRSTALLSQNALCLIHFVGNELIGILAKDRPLRDPHREGFDFVWNRVISGGWTNAFTAEVYTLVGGYTNEPLGEDMRLAQLASIARGYFEKGELIPFVEVAKNMSVKEESNFIRIGHGLVTKSQPYDQRQFENQNIKNMAEKDILNALTPWKDIDPYKLENVQRFYDEINLFLCQLMQSVGPENFIDKYAERFMFFIGFRRNDWEIREEDGELVFEIFSWENLIEKIKRHRERHENEFRNLYGERR